MTTRDPAPETGDRTTNPVMGDTMGIRTHTRTRRAISVPPWAVIGYRKDGRPIRPIAGGAEDDDPAPDPADDDPDPGDDPEPDPDPKPKPPAPKDDPKPGDDYVPPSRTEWERIQAALKKSNDDAKRHRIRNKELEEAARAGETEHEKALREAKEEGEKRFREPMKKAGVRAALAEAGFTAPDRLMKLVDWDAVTVDDGDVIGVEAEVDRIKADYPELLPQDKPKPKPKPNGTPKPPVDPKPKTSGEKHAARILGRG